MIGARVTAPRGFSDEIKARVNQASRAALAAAADDGAQVAASIAGTRRGKTGKLATIEATPVRGTADGWAAGFKMAAWYWRFHARGTRRGITPLHFDAEGLKAMRRSFRRELARRLG